MQRSFSRPPTFQPIDSTFEEAKRFLYANQVNDYLARLAYQNVDYTPIETTLRILTKVIHQATGHYDRQGGWVESEALVIPRGSFATRTALKNHADLDVDIVFPDSHKLSVNGGPLLTLREILGTDDTGENIIFEREPLKGVLKQVWTQIMATALPDIPRGWLKTAKPLDNFSRSISIETTEQAPLPHLPIDLFIKVRTNVRGQDVIIGVDKDGPLGERRYQTTTFIPTEGKWLGDRILSPVERAALISLKWWKADLKGGRVNRQFEAKLDPFGSTNLTVNFQASQIEIKSHHLLAALNALHELDINDKLYVPKNVAEHFSLRRVMELMVKILEYINRAYHPATSWFLETWSADGDPHYDYPFPQYSYQVMDTLYLQASGEWDKFQYIVQSGVIPELRDEIKHILSGRLWQV